MNTTVVQLFRALASHAEDLMFEFRSRLKLLVSSDSFNSKRSTTGVLGDDSRCDTLKNPYYTMAIVLHRNDDVSTKVKLKG